MRKPINRRLRALLFIVLGLTSKLQPRYTLRTTLELLPFPVGHFCITLHNVDRMNTQVLGNLIDTLDELPVRWSYTYDEGQKRCLQIVPFLPEL